MRKPSDKMRDQETPMACGQELHRDTLTPLRRQININKPGDYGCDPLENGMFRMVPSGDIVNHEERNRRLKG